MRRLNAKRNKPRGAPGLVSNNTYPKNLYSSRYFDHRLSATSMPHEYHKSTYNNELEYLLYRHQ